MVLVRVLLATADLGEGHNAAARALAEAFVEAYPGCETRTVETLRLMGGTVSLGTKESYRLGVGPFGWCYQAFFKAVWRHRRLADAINWWVGRRAGPALERHVREFRPDVVVSTFPMASAGFAWLRRRGRLAVPVLAAIPDFAPHPFWVLPDLDLHLVSHRVCLSDVAAVSPHAAARVVTAPVPRRFTPKETDQRRRGRPLRLLATFGGLGLGRVTSLVRTVLAADRDVRLVVVCGHNERLCRRLLRLDPGDGRLEVHGWVEDVPALLDRVDAVINNAGGASALEALACGVPVLLADPIPGHGRANAARMAQAGVATVCTGAADLAATVRRLARDDAYAADLASAARRYAAGRDLAADVRAATDELLSGHGFRGSSDRR